MLLGYQTACLNLCFSINLLVSLELRPGSGLQGEGCFVLGFFFLSNLEPFKSSPLLPFESECSKFLDQVRDDSRVISALYGMKYLVGGVWPLEVRPLSKVILLKTKADRNRKRKTKTNGKLTLRDHLHYSPQPVRAQLWPLKVPATGEFYTYTWLSHQPVPINWRPKSSMPLGGNPLSP